MQKFVKFEMKHRTTIYVAAESILTCEDGTVEGTTMITLNDGRSFIEVTGTPDEIYAKLKSAIE